MRDVRAIIHLAWPVLIGQLAIIAFGVIDTAMVGRFSSTDLAALALGASIYISIYISLTGIVAALSPIAGNLFGAGQFDEIGETVRQSAWLAAALALLGMALLFFPGPLLHITRAPDALVERTTAYLRILAFGLPASLAFRIFNALSTAIGRPRFVMALQVAALAIKFPLNTWLIFGGFGVPALGGPGCAIASTAINWMAALASLILMLRAAPFRQLRVFARGSWPARAPLLGLLRLGLPMGISYLIEVTSYTFMALFIARFGTHTLAAHQIAGNVGTVLYMIPMSIGIATSTLVAQAIGAGRRDEARVVSRHGILLAFLIALVLALLLMASRGAIAAAYTPDPFVIHTAAGLLSIVAIYHVFDALQVSTAFVLRGYRVSVVPTLIYAVALWGVGLGGGYVMGFDTLHMLSPWWRGANGFWIANSASLAVAAGALLVYRSIIVRR